MLGYGAFLGWLFVCVFGLLPSIGSPEPSPFSYSCCLIAFFLGMFGLTFLSAFTPITLLERCEPWYAPVGAVCGLLIPVCAILSPVLSLALPAVLALSFLSGAAASSFYYLWDSTCLRLHVSSNLRFLCMSLALGSVAFLGCQLMVVRGFHGMLCALLLLVSVCLMAFVRKGTVPLDDAFLPSPQDDEAPRIRFGSGHRPAIANLDRRIRLLFFLFGIAFGIAWMMLVNRHPLVLEPVFAFVILGMAVLGFVFRRDSEIRDGHVSMLMRICIMVIAVCFLMVVVLSGMPAIFFLGVVCSFWQVFWVIDTALLLRHTQDYAFSTLKHTATGKLSSSAGMLIGQACALAAIIVLGYDQALLGLFCAVIIVCIVSSMTLLPFSKATMLRGEGASADEGDEGGPSLRRGQPTGWAKACLPLVEEYGLTPREAEVLERMACGKSNRAISEELVLSEHTVKSHVYNIYQKLRIHSRQEMFEAFERFADRP